VVAAVLAAAGVFALAHRHSAGSGGSDSADSGTQLIAGEAIVRGEATTWITSQVGRDVLIACDAAMCADLAQHGFPAGNLSVLRPTSVDPYGSQLVIATASIRSLFGARLESTFAPMVIASFGTGAARIDVRIVAADGARAYSAALSADLQARKTAGAALVANKRVTVSPSARAQLVSGEIDTRVITAIAFAAGQEAVRILSFGGAASGASPAVPLRWAYLGADGPGPAPTRAAYLKSLLASIRALRTPYVPLNVATVLLAGGLAAVRIEFAAPSPLGLLKS
jgi:hypothetical protein